MDKEKEVVPKTTVEFQLSFVQEIINYLQKKPYEEVYQLVGKIITVANNQNSNYYTGRDTPESK